MKALNPGDYVIEWSPCGLYSVALYKDRRITKYLKYVSDPFLIIENLFEGHRTAKVLTSDMTVGYLGVPSIISFFVKELDNED
jgi:hypothetical protein